MSENKALLDMNCGRCGAAITLDIDNLIGFCPYCGNKLLVDPIAFKDVLAEREKTKRCAMKYAHEKEMFDAKAMAGGRKAKFKIVLGATGAISILLAYLLSNISTAAFGGLFAVGVICLFALLIMTENTKKE